MLAKLKIFSLFSLTAAILFVLTVQFEVNASTGEQSFKILKVEKINYISDLFDLDPPLKKQSFYNSHFAIINSYGTYNKIEHKSKKKTLRIENRNLPINFYSFYNYGRSNKPSLMS